jgi:hypothetical protein
MVSRRDYLLLGASALAGVAGCAGGSGGSTPDETATSPGSIGIPTTTAGGTPSDTATPTPTGPLVDDGPTRTPGDVPEWTPTWTAGFDGRNVLGLDVADGILYATTSAQGGPAAVATVAPDEESVRWQTTFPGEAVAGAHAASGPNDTWGVTVADDAVYAASGNTEDREWSAVRALGRADGERRWSVRRERRVGVAGVADGLVVITATEFRERRPDSMTPSPTDGGGRSATATPDPLETTVLGVDAATGEVRWEVAFRGVGDVAVGATGVGVAGADGLVSLDPTGSRRFTVDAGPGERVVAAGDRLYYRTEGGTLHAVTASGRVAWRRPVPARDLLAGGDRLYAGGDRVVAVTPDGTVAWRDDERGYWLFGDPDGDTLYARAGQAADRAAAYDVSGRERWTFAPPSTDAWPAAATSDAAVVTAITGETADDPFYTVYAVDADGRATAAFGRDTVFDAGGHDGTVYLADGESRLLALDPTGG